MNEKIMNLVNAICNMESTNCRALNKSHLARELMDIAGIPNDAKIHEIPLDWDNMTMIMFTVSPDTVHKVNYYFGLFAGIGTDGNFHFELYKCGEWDTKNRYFDFYFRDKLISIDYFKN